jgi:hypothetical protein
MQRHRRASRCGATWTTVSQSGRSVAQPGSTRPAHSPILEGGYRSVKVVTAPVCCSRAARSAHQSLHQPRAGSASRLVVHRTRKPRAGEAPKALCVDRRGLPCPRTTAKPCARAALRLAQRTVAGRCSRLRTIVSAAGGSQSAPSAAPSAGGSSCYSLADRQRSQTFWCLAVLRQPAPRRSSSRWRWL